MRIGYGLGNQMFQYAIGRRLSQHKGVALGLDISHYDHQIEDRAYHLDRFNIRARLVTPAEALQAQGRQGRGLLARAWRRLLPYYRRRRIIERRKFQYDPRLLRLPRQAYLDGFWQNEKYFAPIASAIRAELTLKEPLTAASADVARQIDSTQAVGVHVRRGDYAHNTAINRRHGLCSLEYYQTCARRILDQYPQAMFYVFSDDPHWAAANVELFGPRMLVNHNGPERDYEDLHLLSRCQHFIIANSTFSWWAAWLSAAPGKLVYAPRRWQASNDNDTSDVLPAGWQPV